MKQSIFSCIAILTVVGSSLFLYPDNKEIATANPKKIVSLSPSITLLLIDLGLSDKICGVTSYDPLAREKKIIGTLTKPNIEEIFLLQPDMIVASEEDASVQRTELLGNIFPNVVILPRSGNFQELNKNFIQLGKKFNLNNTTSLSDKYLAEYNHAKKKKLGLKAVILLSIEPLIAVGHNCYLDSLIIDAGCINPLPPKTKAYPIISIEELALYNTDFIITTNVSDKEILSQKLSSLGRLTVNSNKIYYIPPEVICYYTPENYLASLKLLNEIIEGKK